MFFKKLSKAPARPQVFLGSPEAEAEATVHSRVSLADVYEDFHNLLPELSGEKFIVVGRKGAGKSAFAEYVCLRAREEPNLFAHFVRASEFQIEKAIQFAQQVDAAVESETFFIWLIYTNILRIFVENAAIADDKNYELLRQFLRKNSGYINIKDYEIKSLVEKHGFDVSIEQFKRFFRATTNRNVEIKSERAPYYKLLPHLEEVVVKVLSSRFEIENGNSYALFFDDLDTWFSVNNKESADSLMSLIRACRRVNNDIFGKNGIHAKAIILIRDDIEAYLAKKYADSAKMFSSYSCRINWYQEEYASKVHQENELNLKKFINVRIGYAFKRAGLEYNRHDPWESLVANHGDRSTFKQIVNQTLFRPRDILLVFKPLESGKFEFPLSRQSVNSLIDVYADELAKEVKNELSSFYSELQVNNIFLALSEISKSDHYYDDALRVIDECCNDVAAPELLEHLFDRSIIGTADEYNWFWFKCRQRLGESNELKLDKSQRIVVQYGIKAYTARRYG